MMSYDYRLFPIQLWHIWSTHNVFKMDPGIHMLQGAIPLRSPSRRFWTWLTLRSYMSKPTLIWTRSIWVLHGMDAAMQWTIPLALDTDVTCLVEARRESALARVSLPLPFSECYWCIWQVESWADSKLLIWWLKLMFALCWIRNPRHVGSTMKVTSSPLMMTRHELQNPNGLYVSSFCSFLLVGYAEIVGPYRARPVSVGLWSGLLISSFLRVCPWS